MPELLISGVGVSSAVGIGKDAFYDALMSCDARFGVMCRPGRQCPQAAADGDERNAGATTRFLGAEFESLTWPEPFSTLPRSLSFTARVAIVTLQEAWDDAGLDELEPDRIGLVVGGSNLQQRDLVLAQDAYRGRLAYLRPTYGMSFLDTDVCGACSEVFGIRGPAYTVGGASASGQLAVVQAALAVASGRVDACIAVGALADLSYWECQGLRSLGAMGSDRFADEPASACRPFDSDRDGFIFGESCAALVIEDASSVARRGAGVYGRLSGWAVEMDANRNPNPSFEGEVSVIKRALAMAGRRSVDVDYVNPHGSGSVIGDETELRAIVHCGLGGAPLNATKSVVGHGLTSAGAVELAATLLQMRRRRLHPCRNLDAPIARSLNWVRQPTEANPRVALKLSFGFGGINTATCVESLF
jgi:malonyl-ACP decarboxylase